MNDQKFTADEIRLLQPEEVKKLLEAKRAENLAAKENALKAIERYFDDEHNRAMTIKAEIEKLNAEKDLLTEKKKDLEQKVVEATIGNERAEAENAKQSIRNIEAEIALISDQLKAFNNFSIRGTKANYDAAKELIDGFEESNGDFQESFAIIADVARKMSKEWEALAGSWYRTENIQKEVSLLDSDFSGQGTPASQVIEEIQKREERRIERERAVKKQEEMMKQLDRDGKSFNGKAEYRTVLGEGETYRERLNHETGEYERIGRWNDSNETQS